MTESSIILTRCVLPALIVLSAGVLRGDVLQIENRQPIDNIRITGLRAGMLVFRLPDGRETEEKLSLVERIAFDRWPLFNLAEKQRAAGEFEMAANTYEKTLEVLEQQAGAARPIQPADWTRDDLALLARGRLIGAYDRANRFDLAVKSYLEVIERMPEGTNALRPTGMPPAQSSFLRAAREHVELAIARSQDAEYREAMQAWLKTWPQPADVTTRPETRVAGNDAGGENKTKSPGAVFHEALEGVATLIARDAFTEATEQLDQLGRRSAHRPAEWYYWRGRALEGVAPDLDVDSRREALIRGGLAYLRVVIHFPESEHAVESLFRTGVICESLGRREQATTVWQDQLRRWPDTAPWNRLAAEKLERLGAK